MGGGGRGVWLWWAYRTYDICTLLSIQYLGREGGGGGLVVNNTLQLKFSSICFYCIISSKPWGGGGGEQIWLFSSSVHFGVCGGGGGCRATCLFLVLRLRRRGVFLVLVQNLSARGLVQKPSKYSLSSSTLHRKKTQKTTKIFTFKHQKISLAFPF